MISFAGTSDDRSTWKLVLRDESKTLSDTQAHELSETHTSESHERALTDTYRLTHTQSTSDLLAQLQALQTQLLETQAENKQLKAQVSKRSSSSTSVNNQL